MKLLIAAGILASATLSMARGETVPCPQPQQPSTAPWRGTKLIKAIFESNFRVAAGLIEEGANLNEKDDLGNTPLVLALTPREPLEPVGIVSHANRQMLIQHEKDARKKIVSLLLTKGADPNLSGALGRTPLMQIAAWRREKTWDLQVASALMNKGARVDVHDDYGNTPLILSTASESIYLVDLFLQHGADPEVRNCSNESAISLAREKHLPVLQKRLEAATKAHHSQPY